MTSLLFNLYFYTLTAIFALAGAPLALLRSSTPLRRWIFRWSRSVRFGMKHIAGITLEIRGREFMPTRESGNQTAIIASKHHSYIDAVILFSEMPDLAAVAMAELADVPFVGLVFKKLGMIMIDRSGGKGAHHLASGAGRAIKQSRSILIYPEGHIPEVGARVPFKKGVWHLQQTSRLAVVPVATNIGLRWSQNKWVKTRGHAVVEFLAPVEPGMAREPFMAELEARIEQQTDALLAEAGFRRPLTRAVTPRPMPANLALIPDV